MDDFYRPSDLSYEQAMNWSARIVHLEEQLREVEAQRDKYREALDWHRSPTPHPEFLEWIADRLVNIYGESDNVDFVLSLRQRAETMRAVFHDTETP